MTSNSRSTMLAGLAATLALQFFLQHEARAVVGDLNVPYPPISPPCTASSAKVIPGLGGNSYSFTGTCLINLATDKFDVDHPKWAHSNVTATAFYNSKNQTLSETLTFSSPSGPITIVNNAWCDQDPWQTPEDCTLDPQALRGRVISSIGLDIGQNSGHRGPLSLIVLSPTLIHQLIAKQESKPPRPPTNVDPVNWPVDNGKSTRVTVQWMAGDMSDSRWVMQFDVETSKQKTDSDSAYSKAGQVLGIGPKQRYDVNDLNRVYVFTLPSAMEPIGSFYFRVCAVNDADRQCSAPIQARAPTKLELMAHAGVMHVVTGPVGAPSGGGTPATPRAVKPSGPIALGTRRPQGSSGASGGSPSGGNGPTPLGLARPVAPLALGARQPAGDTGGTGGAAGASGGPGGLTRAGGPPSKSVGVGTPATPSGGGAPAGIVARRPIGPVARLEPGGGAKPGTVGIPDLEVERGMFVRGRLIAWGSGLNLALRADATHTCPVPMSFQFRNAGNGPAQNVTAAIRDSQNPMLPVATETLASMAAGQSSSVGGVLKVAAAPAARTLILVARVHEAGKIHEKDVANDHGSITLNVTCK